MVRNYLLIAYRNLTRQFSYSFINITGLAIGIACSLVIFLYVYGEWSADKHFKNAHRIYRIAWSFYNIGQYAAGPEKLVDVLPGEYDGIEAATRVKRAREMPVVVGDKSFVEPMAYHVDSSFFRVFQYQFVQGDPLTAMKDPHSVVLTEKQAIKFFGTSDVLGKVIELGKKKVPYTIFGIVKSENKNSHLKAQMWVSITGQLSGESLWTSMSTFNYFLVKENVSQTDLDQAMERLREKKIYPTQAMGMNFEDWKKNANSVKYYIQPLEDIYLKSKFNFEISTGGNVETLYIFGAISVFILLLAAVNFVNLTTARASRRAKEVGIRKALGTSRAKLIGQFLLESTTVSILAMMLSLAFAEIFLLAFRIITDTELITTLWDSPVSIFLFLLFSIVVGLLSGIYPAIYLTAFNPVKVLKGNHATSGGKSFRNILVVFQFSISICLIICTSIILQQLHYIQTTDLGFKQDHVLTIDGIEKLGTSAETFKQELMTLAEVKNASLHTGEPGSKNIMTFTTYKTAEMESELSIFTYLGDQEYMDVMGYQLIQGSSFTPGLKVDTTSIILNEAAVKALNLGPNPLGTLINKNLQVIGVVRDFHWETLRNAIGPVAIMLREAGSPQLALKIATDRPGDLLKKIESKWKSHLAEEPFKYHFLDDNFGALAKKEEVFGKAISFFTVLAIFISCLGLYGLAAFTSEQRTKEIGIRKVLGASVSTIVMMLNSNFTRLVLISILISVPAAFYISDQWLAGFAYKTSPQVWVFVAGSGAALVIALLTVSYHALKAATINPVDTLKYE